MRSLEIDLDKDIFKINGQSVKDRAVLVALPCQESGFWNQNIFNPESVPAAKEEYERLEVNITKKISNKPL